jgi:hypothetical protein
MQVQQDLQEQQMMPSMESQMLDQQLQEETSTLPPEEM